MDSFRTEIDQAKDVSEPIVDILNGEYLFHWTDPDNITAILKEGLLSAKLARRIGRGDIKPNWIQSEDQWVYLTPEIDDYWYSGKVRIKPVVGVVLIL